VRKCIEYSENISPTDFPEAVSIIKPMKGFNEFTFSNYTSWIEQDYGKQNSIEYIFSFDEGDAGIKIAEKVPFLNKKILNNPILEGYSGKMSALTHGLENASHELIVFSDGDTKAQRDTLAKIMSQFEQGAQIVTCLALYNKAKNIWARIYASSWNFAEIGLVGPSIINRGDQVVGNTFALYKKTLEQIGGLEKYKNFIAEDIAIGKGAYEENISIMSGPLIESPVGEMSFSNLIDKFSRAALYAITMRGLRNNWQFIFIYSYFLLLLPPGVFIYSEIAILSALLALGRVVFASYLWFITTGEKRIFVECILGDILFFLVYIRSLFIKTIRWSGKKYRVDSKGKLSSM
jgi:hypothetical protein